MGGKLEEEMLQHTFIEYNAMLQMSFPAIIVFKPQQFQVVIISLKTKYISAFHCTCLADHLTISPRREPPK